MASMIDRFFGISASGSSWKKEVIAGLTTFSTMVYILAVNPLILSAAGMPFSAVLTATAIATAFASMLMAFFARLPIAVGPGMGLNAFFAYTVVLGMGYTWQFALTAVFIEGLLFILLSLFRIREAIIDAIPIHLKTAISVGIGLFIALIGLANAGVIITGMQVDPNSGQLSGVLVKLGNMHSPTIWIAFFGLIVASVGMVRNWPAALLIGILAATLLGVPLGVTQIPKDFQFVSLPPSLKDVFFQMDFSKVFTADMALILFTLLMVNLFDTVGTLIACCTKAGLLTKEGKIPNAKQALLADAVGTTAASILGTSVVTAYVESAAGISAGGKTGLTALVVGILFLLALFFAPTFLMIPAAATAPALIIVGLFMLSEVVHIPFHDLTEAIPVFLTIIMMPFTYSIAEGIVFGTLSYVLIKLLTGRHKELHPFLYFLAGLFVISLWFKQ